MSVGKPLKFASLFVLQQSIEDYFKENPREEWTITGLAVSLRTNRQTLMNYESKDEYVDTIKAAKNKIESEYERRGWSGKSQAFAIFALKNFDWKDKSDHALTDGEGKPLNMAPQISMIDFDSYLQSKHAKSGSENVVERFHGPSLDERDSTES